MTAIKTKLAKKAVRTTARHSAKGAASKLKRSPLRTSTVLAVGCAIGLVAGWWLARSPEPGFG